MRERNEIEFSKERLDSYKKVVFNKYRNVFNLGNKAVSLLLDEKDIEDYSDEDIPIIENMTFNEEVLLIINLAGKFGYELIEIERGNFDEDNYEIVTILFKKVENLNDNEIDEDIF